MKTERFKKIFAAARCSRRLGFFHQLFGEKRDIDHAYNAAFGINHRKCEELIQNKKFARL